jgi:hypothetical protein
MSINRFINKRNVLIFLVLVLLTFNFTLVWALRKLLVDTDVSGVREFAAMNHEQYKLPLDPKPTYDTIVAPQRIDSLHLPGTESSFGVIGANKEEQLYGLIVRALRFSNITKRVEKKYGLPTNLLLAMVMQETGGILIMPNSADDGGIGLCHMQPKTAKLFGLMTYHDCKYLKSRTHGRELRSLIAQSNSDIVELIKYDDRFHPLLNLDAVGRMMAFNMEKVEKLSTPLETSILRYAGRKNFKKYLERVKEYRSALNNPWTMFWVRHTFNKMNPNLTIGGKPADFDLYIEYYHQQNRNFGLDTYK